ncbi:hypothetical protein EVAR_90847_1, partial [Eumeta japonica]
ISRHRPRLLRWGACSILRERRPAPALRSRVSARRAAPRPPSESARSDVSAAPASIRCSGASIRSEPALFVRQHLQPRQARSCGGRDDVLQPKL